MEDVVRSMNEKSDNKLWILFVMILFVIGVWLGSYWYIENHYPIYDVKGQVGDMFGAINALFSGLAFAGLIYAIYLQNKELKLQKDELRKTQAIAESQEKALKSQAESQNLSVFQATFTQMLEIHFKLLDSYANGNLTGSQYFFQNIAACLANLNTKDERSILRYMDRRSHKHLFHLSNIVDLIDENFANDISKRQKYLKRLRDVLSVDLLDYMKAALNFKYYDSIKINLAMIYEAEH